MKKSTEEKEISRAIAGTMRTRTMRTKTRINKEKFTEWLISQRDVANCNEKMSSRHGDYCNALKHSVEREIYAEIAALIRFPDPAGTEWLEVIE